MASRTRGRAAQLFRGRSSNRRTSTPPNTHNRRSPSAETFPPTPQISDEEVSTATSRREESMPPPVLVSPIKRRARNAAPGINKLSDLEVWSMTDSEILDAALTTWRSDAYDHYNISLQRDFDSSSRPVSLTYVFTCKSSPDLHAPIYRPRSKTAEGTSNLVRTMKICLEAQGLSSPASRTNNSQAIIPYSQAAHRALIALRCAKNNRPFNMIEDEDYQAEVQMLRPGTILPSPNTVSRDINSIYLALSQSVKQYFMSINSAIHLVLDGWTSPLVSSYLGLVVVWYNDGVIHRVILEFIRLKQKHDGRYLAKVVADCLKRFGLEEKLFSLCMDNASNCDKLAEELQVLVPDFRGADGRLRCLAHIFNLVAKVFISFFFKKPKIKKAVRVAAGARAARFADPDQALDVGDEEEIVLDPGESPTDEDPIAIEEAHAEIEDAEDDIDEGQAVHNERVARTVQEKAIQYMEENEGIILDPREVKMAQQIFPRVSGLARRIHDTHALNEKFVKLVSETESLEGNRRALVRRVPTRWNADLDCLLSHFYFRDVIAQMTAIPSLELQKYALSPEQWKMAEDVREILLLFDEPTKIFSTAQVPLIVDVLPTLEDLRRGLMAARDDTLNDVSSVARVACQASIFLVDKYSTFAGDCDIYSIAIVMCPDRKLKWFKDRKRAQRQIRDIEKKVVAAWNNTYAPDEEQSSVPETRRQTRSRYAPIEVESQYPDDHILTYLKAPLVSTTTIKEAGGYIQFWNQAAKSRPRLARMAMDYCSAPATSVDAERAFSTGRRQVNFMQTNMNSQTFKAQMAVGSWARSPIFSGLEHVRDIVASDMDPRSDSGSASDIQFFSS